MPASELQKKTLYFFIVAAIITLALVLFPFLTDAFQASMVLKFGAVFEPDGSVTIPDARLAHDGVVFGPVGPSSDRPCQLAMALVITIVPFSPPRYKTV